MSRAAGRCPASRRTHELLGDWMRLAELGNSKSYFVVINEAGERIWTQLRERACFLKKTTNMLRQQASKGVIPIVVISLALLVTSLPLSNHAATRKTELANSAPENEWIGKTAPEIFPGHWINSKALTLAALRGNVVLLEFWTYGCYNCRNTIPYLKTWYNRYKGASFEIVGVHSPEFDREKTFSSVVSSTAELGIKYPVVTDNELKTWSAYRQEYWPVLYLIDKKGIIRYVHVGEGNYEQTEQWIKNLLEEKA